MEILYWMYWNYFHVANLHNSTLAKFVCTQTMMPYISKQRWFFTSYLQFVHPRKLTNLELSPYLGWSTDRRSSSVVGRSARWPTISSMGRTTRPFGEMGQRRARAQRQDTWTMIISPSYCPTGWWIFFLVNFVHLLVRFVPGWVAYKLFVLIHKRDKSCCLRFLTVFDLTIFLFGAHNVCTMRDNMYFYVVIFFRFRHF